MSFISSNAKKIKKEKNSRLSTIHFCRVKDIHVLPVKTTRSKLFSSKPNEDILIPTFCVLSFLVARALAMCTNWKANKSLNRTQPTHKENDPRELEQ